LVYLPEFLVDELRDYILHLRKESLKAGQGGSVNLLFLDPAENGYPYSQRKIQGLVKKVCSSAGLRRRHPHDLRHTYATILLISHKSPAYVQKQLGHHSIQITVDIYGHWFSGEGRENLDEAFIVKENPKEVVSHSGLKTHTKRTQS
jgi:integrase